jgi:hypothetical protein
MPVKTKYEEAGPMTDRDAHREWMKQNTVMINARLQKSTDADILQFLQGKSIAAEIKKGLRLLIEREQAGKAE